MFLIACPYCKESRDQNEFSPAGEAFIARPENPEALSDEEWADYVFYRTNIKGDHWEQWVHTCLLYTSPSPRDISGSRMPSSA